MNWGLIQVSDKYDATGQEADFDANDEARFHRFAVLISQSLDALRTVRNLKKRVVESQ